MADFSTLIASIEETIKTNGVQAITGQILQDEMLLMVSAINQLKQDTLEGYAFYGEPLADGGSASVTQNTFFLVTAGTYTINGNTFAVTGEGVSVVVYDTVNDEVRNEGLILPFDNAPTSGSSNPITSGAVADALAEIPANFAACLYDRRSAGTPQSPYTFRQSGGDGVDYLKRIKARTLVWNQLAKEINTTNYREGGLISIADGKITFTGDGATYYNQSLMTTRVNIVAGHTYLFAISVSNNTITKRTEYFAIGAAINSVFATIPIYGITGRAGVIKQATTSQTLNIVGFSASESGPVADGETCSVSDIIFIDLTLLGWVPSSVSEFRAVYPLSYYSYTPALLINNAATDLESTGFNQWDEEWEVGGYDTSTGEKNASTVKIRSKNKIDVLPGVIYYGYCGDTASSIWALEYDADGIFLNRYYRVDNRQFTPGADCRKIAFYTTNSYGTTYNNDICINISDPDRNGTYEPYWKATRHLGLDAIQAKEVGTDTIVTINGLDGVGDNVDLLKDGKYIEKRRARVDLGSLTWGLRSGSSHTFDTSTDTSGITNSILKPATAETPMVASSRYTPASRSAQGLDTIDKSIGVTTTGYLVITDTAYTDPAAFKTAMAGVMLDYPLATPKEYELVEPIQPMLEVDELGTERRLPEDTADAVNAPFESDSNYSVSVANLVRKLSE